MSDVKYIVIGMKDDKDREKMVNILRSYIGEEIRYINIEPIVEERLDEYGDGTGDKVVVLD